MLRSIRLLIIGYALWLVLLDVSQYLGYDTFEQIFAKTQQEQKGKL